MFRKFAKIMQWSGNDVLIWLTRDDEDLLCVNLQIWLARIDHQLQATIKIPSEEDVSIDLIHDGNIYEIMSELGIQETIDEIEAQV